MKVELYDNDKWVIIGPDIENPQEPDDPLVKISLGKSEQGEITVVLYKDILDDLRNHKGGYEPLIIVHQNGSVTFQISYNGRFIQYAPQQMQNERVL